MNLKILITRLTWRALVALGACASLAILVMPMTPVAQAVSKQNDAMVRVVHASPDAGAVDVYVDGTKLLNNFTFGTITDYQQVPAGSHKIQVTPTGKDISTAVITQDVSVNAGGIYTVAAIGTSASGFSLTAFVDNNMVSGNNASVRVYHLSPDAGPVDVAAGGSTVISGLAYKNASNYLSVPAGSYTFNVTATTSGAKVAVPATLSGGMVYSVFAVGLLKGTPALAFKVAAVAATPGMPNTGSDPSAVPASQNQPFNPWYLGVLALLLIGAGLGVRRYAQARQK